MVTTITWLHLSDFHCERTLDFDREVVLTALLEDLKRLSDGGNKPDFVLLSGDIASHGKEEEYDTAAHKVLGPILANTGLTRRELFLMPGNHDVDWDIIRMISPKLFHSLETREKVSEFLGNEKQREMIFRAMGSYRSFVYRFFGDDWNPANDPLYACTRFPELGRRGMRRVAVVGLNSAWLSGSRKGRLGDYGELLVGEPQVTEGLLKAQGAEIKIALLHHPFAWLREFDRTDVESRVRQKCGFVCRGHVHRPDFVQERSFDGNMIMLPAGAAYLSRDFPNSYNVVTLDLTTRKGVLVVRRYNDRQRTWVNDLDATGQQGEYGFVWQKAQGPRRASISRGQQQKRQSKPKSIPGLKNGRTQPGKLESSLSNLAAAQERMPSLVFFQMHLEMLDMAFSSCWLICSRAVSESAALNDEEFGSFVARWEECKQRAYFAMLAFAGPILELKPQLIQYREAVEKGKDNIEVAIGKGRRRELIEVARGFREDVATFIAAVRTMG